MSRYKAAALHLFFSGLVLFTIFLLIAYVWYPYKLFALAAGADLLRLIICVDLIIGPLVMLVIFDAKKKLIKMDVAIVLICQICFMSYGLWAMFSSRPVFFVFADQHFYLVKANEIDKKDLQLASEPFNTLPLLGPYSVGTRQPDDAKVKAEVLFAGLSGMGIQDLPKYYVPYAQLKVEVIKSGKTSKQLGVDFETRQRVSVYEKLHTMYPVLFLPMVNKTTPLIVVINAKTAEFVDLI
jgi:hypothetical protein